MKISLCALLAPLFAAMACRPAAVAAAGANCDGAAARPVSHTGTLNVVWGAGPQFFLRSGEQTLQLLIDRPERVSADVLQGLSARSLRVDGRETSGTMAKICADDVTLVEAPQR